MIVLEDYKNIPSVFHESFVTIGNFDGVHLGHREIFQRLIREAKNAGRQAVVITFDPHPKMLLHPERRPFYLINTKEEKIDLIKREGIDGLIIIPFTYEFSRITADEFIFEILWKNFKVKKVLIGHDYTFGHAKGGNKHTLIQWGKKLGFSVEIMEPYTMDGKIISSTLVRKTIQSGDVRKAAAYLGRPYNMRGTVIHGHHRGKGLGFPTANVLPEKVLFPADGVYAAFAELGEELLPAVVNIGNNPTFGDDKVSIEAFILDFTGDIYGQKINVLFLERIREERKFPSPAELVEQIQKDIKKAQEIFSKNNYHSPKDNDIYSSSTRMGIRH
ncbi:MAG: bifunctional riboflavin kinase/FAD synthetase [Syntrophales bacterium]|nr:bifunctional riboflavin kinase/FAD synthetase [Syntrophales bacterium]